jgi:hypothetical protein
LELEPIGENAISYRSEATYINAAGNFPLPGERIRFVFELAEEEDVLQKTHRIEFIALDYGTLASATHQTKEYEGGQSRVYSSESKFEFRRYDEICTQTRMEEVEEEIQAVLENLTQVESTGALSPL